MRKFLTLLIAFLFIAGTSAVAFAGSVVRLPDPEPPSCEELLCGDVNADGVVDIGDITDINDVIIFQKYSLEDLACPENADLNNDGDVTIEDSHYFIHTFYMNEWASAGRQLMCSRLLYREEFDFNGDGVINLKDLNTYKDDVMMLNKRPPGGNVDVCPESFFKYLTSGKYVPCE